MKLSHLWRTGKRAVAAALIGLVLGTLAVPATSLADTRQAPGVVSSPGTPSGDYVVRPMDGVGDSPVMP